jgi:hypothetical protein
MAGPHRIKYGLFTRLGRQGNVEVAPAGETLNADDITCGPMRKIVRPAEILPRLV